MYVYRERKTEKIIEIKRGKINCVRLFAYTTVDFMAL